MGCGLRGVFPEPGGCRSVARDGLANADAHGTVFHGSLRNRDDRVSEGAGGGRQKKPLGTWNVARESNRKSLTQTATAFESIHP